MDLDDFINFFITNKEFVEREVTIREKRKNE